MLFISTLLVCIALTQCTIVPQLKFTRKNGLGNRQLSSRCSDLLDGLPSECDEQASYVRNVYEIGGVELDQMFVSVFCSETCGEPIYNVFRQCDEDEANYIDFLCSENSQGEVCGEIFANELNEIEEPPNCDPVTEDFCPTCRRNLAVQLNEDWGCCFYTTLRLAGEGDLLDSCNIDFPGLCVGGYSGEAVRVPSSAKTILSALGFLPLAFVVFLTALAV